MKKLFFSLLILLLFFGCVGKEEINYEIFNKGNFSVSYPQWQQRALKDEILAVEKAGCSVTIKEENFSYMPGVFKLRTKIIRMALESISLIIPQEEMGELSAILEYSVPDNTSHGKIRLIPCDGKIYWVVVGCPKNADDSFFETVLDSASCSIPPVWKEEKCPQDVGFEKRPFYLATTSSAAHKTDQSWSLAMERVPETADILLWQFIPKWEEFLPGHNVSTNTSNEVKVIKTYADIQGLDLFVGLDPTKGLNRSKLYQLAPGRKTKFSDPDFRQAFKSAALYYVQETKPKYLALGIEINMYYAGNENDFESYVSLYKETYDGVKKVSPDTKIFATIQLEDIQGMWDWGKHAPTWFIISDLEPKLDLLVLSTYPSLLFHSPSEIPADYLSKVRNYTNLKIAIGETGYSSGKGIIGDQGSEEKQKEYLMQLLKTAKGMDMEFVTWITMYDAEWEDLPQELEPFKDMGLRYANDTRKEAWCVMKAAKNLPME